MSSTRIARLTVALLTVSMLVAWPVTAHEGGEPAFEGVALETAVAGPYVYVHLRTDDGAIWVAGPRTEIAVGDRVLVGTGTTMKDFRSETLDRTFETIEFVGEIEVAGAHGATDHGEASTGHDRATAPAGAAVDPVVPADGGSTIADLYERKDGLSGTPVVVRGRVVKFSAGIMNRNWIHIQDGTGTAGSNDLTVTTAATVAVGDVVVVRGTLAVDRDFGMGYRYDLIVEDAAVTVE